VLNRRAAYPWLIALMALAFAHSAAYALVVPLWQAPDEPMLYEYVALTEQLGRIPAVSDRSPVLEQQIFDSLVRNDFWRYTTGSAVAPQTLADGEQLFFMPRQVGGDPPVYFGAAALILRLVPDWTIDMRARLLRLLNAALVPLVVLCSYGVACEFVETRKFEAENQGTKEQRNDATSRNHQPPATSRLPLAVASFIALQPMLAFVSGSVGNDALANVCAAVLCWAWLRMLGRGVTLRRALLVCALLVIGLLTKRTLLPYLVMLPVTGLGYALRSRRVIGALGLGLALGLVGIGIWGTRQIDWDGAWGWYWLGGHQPATRISAAGHGAALEVQAGQIAVYPVPTAAGDRLRGGSFQYGARVWSDNEASGRLIVLNDQERHEIRFVAHKAVSTIDTTASVYPATKGVVLAFQTDSGTLYADDFWAEGAGIQLLTNGTLDLPALNQGSSLLEVLQYLRLPEVFWAISSGLGPKTLPQNWGALLFASFWGHFGWMGLPFVFGSAWQPALVGFCAVGALGVILAFIQLKQARRQLGALVGLCLVGVLLPLINAYAMPSNQALSQGRYLFPLLAPIAILLAAGQSALVPQRAQPVWLAVWLGFLGLLAGSALMFIVMTYRMN
jgi:hypothetical protein